MQEDPRVAAPEAVIAPTETERRAGESFEQAAAIMARLRGPGGCPWDREQTLATIRRYTVEEVYEVVDAIDRGHWSDLREELGDLLLQVLFYAQIAADEGQFTIADVLETLNRKLVRRHPHVFGDEASAAAGNRADALARAESAGQVLRNWEEIKRAEKESSHAASLLDTVPRSFPSLAEAQKLGSKAARVGFDWPEIDGVLLKVEEEMRELRLEIAAKQQTGIEQELGDVLFTITNLARHLKVDAELALRASNAKFRRRFFLLEQAAGRPLEELSPAELEQLWKAAKAQDQQ